MSKKLRHTQEKQCIINFNSPKLRNNLQLGDKICVDLHDAMSYENGGVTQLLAMFRSLLHPRTELPDETAVLVISAAVNVVEIKPVRQIAIKIIKAFTKNNSNNLVVALLDRDLTPHTSMLHTCLYSAESFMFIPPAQLVSFWEALFEDGSDLEYNYLMLRCRAFNSYLTRLERATTEPVMLGEKLEPAILKLALNGSLNHDCRQVIFQFIFLGLVIHFHDLTL